MMRAAEFFAGIGLVRLALEQEDWEVVFANDIDAKKLTLYRDNFGDKDFRLCDIRNITPKSIPDVDLATASFPCIDLSLAGNRAGLKGEHSSAFWEFARVLRGMGGRRPKSILIENVLGLVSSKGGSDLVEIVECLNGLGYSCDLVVVDAVFFVPQSRPRLFVIGKLAKPQVNLIPIPFHPARPTVVVDFIVSNPQLNWTLSDLGPLNVRRKLLADFLEVHSLDSPVWWDEARKKHLYSQMNSLHRRKLADMMSSRSISFATVYRRIREGQCRAELRVDGIAGCLRTPRGGSSKQFVIQAGNDRWQVRNMTAKEYAKLQGAPSFKIGVPENLALLGFGDAVCVPAVKWVIRNCISTNGHSGSSNGQRSKTQPTR